MAPLRKNTHDCLLAFYSNYGRISYRFCATVSFMPNDLARQLWPVNNSKGQSRLLISKMKSAWDSQKFCVNLCITFCMRLHTDREWQNEWQTNRLDDITSTLAETVLGCANHVPHINEWCYNLANLKAHSQRQWPPMLKFHDS